MSAVNAALLTLSAIAVLYLGVAMFKAEWF